MIKKYSVSIGALKFLPELVKIRMSIKNSARCYQRDFSSDFFRLGTRLWQYQRMQSLIFGDHKRNFEFTIVMYCLDNAKEVTNPNQVCR